MITANTDVPSTAVTDKTADSAPPTQSQQGGLNDIEGDAYLDFLNPELLGSLSQPVVFQQTLSVVSANGTVMGLAHGPDVLLLEAWADSEPLSVTVGDTVELNFNWGGTPFSEKSLALVPESGDAIANLVGNGDELVAVSAQLDHSVSVAATQIGAPDPNSGLMDVEITDGSQNILLSSGDVGLLGSRSVWVIFSRGPWMGPPYPEQGRYGLNVLIWSHVP